MLSLSRTLVLVAGITPPLQSQVPYKSNEEFKVEMEYVIRPRPLSGNSSIDLMETERDRNRKMSGGEPLPYLILYVSMLQLSDKEERVGCEDSMGKTRLSRKAETNKKYKLDLGFTDDVKDRVSAHEFTILLTSKDKGESSRIVLFIDQDGTFLVNGEKRGKF